MWHVKVPASSANLGSGLDTLGMALPLWFECWFTHAQSLTIELQGEGRDQAPQDERNLIWQAAQALYQAKTGESMPPGRLVVSSQIPLRRGLGSSGAAVVAGLLLANACLGESVPVEELLQWAASLEGHADNAAAALYGGLVLVSQRDERVMAIKYTAPELSVVLVIPAYEVPTDMARALLPARVPRADAVFNAQRVGLWVDALWRRNWELLRTAGEDRLHQPYRSRVIPALDHLLNTALDAGASLATLSGSGPTVLALAPPDHAPTVVQALEHALRALPELDACVRVVVPSNDGAYALRDSRTVPDEVTGNV